MPRAFLEVNNWSALTTQELSSSSDVLYLDPADIALLPDVSLSLNPMSIKLTLFDDTGNVEIIEAIKRNTNNLEVWRGREGTTALTWPVGSKIQARITEESMRASRSSRLWTTYTLSTTSDPNVYGYLEEHQCYHLMLSRNVNIWLRTEGDDPNGDTWKRTLIVEQNSTGGYTVAFNNVRWPDGVAPTVTATADAIDVFEFLRPNGYTEWLGFVKGQNL
jgi:hypothetical protein